MMFYHNCNNLTSGNLIKQALVCKGTKSSLSPFKWTVLTKYNMLSTGMRTTRVQY